MHCPKCGSEYGGSSRFCSHCAARLQSNAEREAEESANGTEQETENLPWEQKLMVCGGMASIAALLGVFLGGLRLSARDSFCLRVWPCFLWGS